MEYHHGDYGKYGSSVYDYFGDVDYRVNKSQGKTDQEIKDWLNANPSKWATGPANRAGGGGWYDELESNIRNNPAAASPVEYEESGSTKSVDIPTDTEDVFKYRNYGNSPTNEYIGKDIAKEYLDDKFKNFSSFKEDGSENEDSYNRTGRINIFQDNSQDDKSGNDNSSSDAYSLNLDQRREAQDRADTWLKINSMKR